MATQRSELYFSVDIETDGPIPGPHSMLSLGAAAFTVGGEMDGETFSANLALLEGAIGHPDTMRWWQQPEQVAAWETCRQDTRQPHEVIEQFSAWVQRLSKKHKATPVFIAWPASFDFMFVYWYLVRFLGDQGRELFSFSALDIKSYAMAVLQCRFKPVMACMPDDWRGLLRNHHVALDDAIDQGQLFCRMLMARQIAEKGKQGEKTIDFNP